jgi:hypothetical protein
MNPMYYCKINGEVCGPHPATTLSQWLKGGFMHPNDLVWTEEEPHPSPAWAFPELNDGAQPSEVRSRSRVSQSGRVSSPRARGLWSVVCGLSWVALTATLICAARPQSPVASALVLAPGLYGLLLIYQGVKMLRWKE